MPNAKTLLGISAAVLCGWLAGVYSTEVSAKETLPGKVTVNKLYVESEIGSDPIVSLAVDADGFLWVSGRSGVKRYNGYTLKPFEAVGHDPTTPSSNVITKLYSHSNGSFWLANAQLHEFNFKTQDFTRYKVGGDFSITTMTEDSRGNLWFGGDDGKLWGFDIAKKKILHTLFEQARPEGAVHAIKAIAHGKTRDTLWIGTNLGVYRFDCRTFALEFFKIPGELASGIDTIRGLAMAPDSRIWIVSFEGISILEPTTGEVHSIKYAPGASSPLPTNELNSIIRDANDRLLVGTDKHGVVVFSAAGVAIDHIPASMDQGANALPPGAVNAMLEDDHQNIWLAVGNFGVYRVNENLEKFRILSRDFANSNSLAFNNVLGLLEDANGKIWIATDGGGLDRFDPASDQFTHFKHNPNDPHSISSDSVISLSEDSRGRIWAGTWAGGISIFDPATNGFSHIKREPDKPADQRLAINNIFRIMKAHDDRMWVSAWLRGMQIIDPDSRTYTTYMPHGHGSDSGIVNHAIQDIEPESENRYWVGGGAGLEYFDYRKQTFTQIPIDDDWRINDLYLEHETKTLWIASSNYLMLFDTKNRQPIRKITMDDGLSSNYIVSVTQDLAGFFWIATDTGLNRLDPATMRIDVFDQRDGLASSQFNRFSHLRTRDGLIYLGGKHGVSVFDPAYMPQNSTPPRIALLNLELNRKPIEAGDLPFVAEHISKLERLELPYDYRDFSIEFTALDFIAPSKNLYRYQLRGYDRDWIEVGSNRRQVHYANLPPGDYTFLVTASNSDGVWNDEAKQLHVHILTPWWSTLWARLCAAGLAIAAIFLFTRWRTRVNRERNTLLQKMVAEKTEALAQANTDIVQLNHNLEDRVQQRTEQLTVEIAERRKAEAKLYHQAFHDSLTGLPNRAWLLKKLEELIARTGQDAGACFGLMFIDGDRFKQVNDTHGHLIGDELLVQMAERLNTLNGFAESTVRLGGDEFTVLFSSLSDAEPMIRHANAILTALEKPFLLGKHQIFFKVSMGMVLCDRTYRCAETVLRDADIAMYMAKSNGQGNWQLFDEQMRERTLALAELEHDLHRAIRCGEFHLVYQPIIHIDSGELSGFEALLRWVHPEHGSIPPDQFIRLAEEIGLIVPIGQWVLREACTALAAWLRAYEFKRSPHMAVNISALQLNQLDFMTSIDEVLEDTGIDSRLLKLELTESVIMENTEVVNRLLEELRTRQIDLAIDDFGTGYSSLRYLDELPMQVLKLDKQFVEKIGGPRPDNDGTMEIIRATIALAHNLKLKVVAEGIETPEQFEFLAGLGCDYGQGFFISRPQTKDQLQAFIESQGTAKPLASSATATNNPSAEDHRQRPTKRLRDRGMG